MRGARGLGSACSRVTASAQVLRSGVQGSHPPGMESGICRDLFAHRKIPDQSA